MKNLVLFLGILIAASTIAVAQNGCGGSGSGASSGSGSGSGSGHGYHGHHNNRQMPAWVQSCLNGTASLPQNICVRVIRECRQWGQQNFGLNQGQMIQKFNQGLLTVELIQTNPPSLTFRVTYGGIGTIEIIDNF
jgi:hypothetical protein